MKKVLCIFLAASFAFLMLTGCGSKETKAKETTKIITESEKVESAESQESVTDTQSETQQQSETVSADFKKTMDDYEAFFDKYIDIVKKYKANPTDMTILSEYSKIMVEYSKMMSDMNGINQSELSPADAAYYLEVTGRITQKLATVA